MPVNREPKPSDAWNKMARVRQMGLGGLQASTIGWVFAGCILLGFAAGAGLDKRQNTTIWTPVLVMVGVAAGFMQMFRILKDVNAAAAQEREQFIAERASEAQMQRLQKSGAPIEAAVDSAPEPLSEERPKRLFSVPAPPLASYEGGTNAPQSAPKADETAGVDDVLKKLLDEQDDEDETDKPQRQTN